MEIKAVARYVRISPRKARLLTDLIKGKDLGEAQQILDFSPKAAARAVAKVLASAAANAENNNKIPPESLFVLRAFVDEGPTLKRFRPRAMGRATRINKRSSHITIVLEEREPEKAASKRRFRRRPKPVDKEKAAQEAAPEEAAEEEMLEAAEEETAPGGRESETVEVSAEEAAEEEAAQEAAEEEPAEEAEDDTPAVEEAGAAEEEAKPDTEGSEG